MNLNLNLQSTIQLNNLAEMPRFGLGTARMKDPQICTDAVKMAIQAGYRMVDTSKNYENENYVGEGIRQSGVSEKEIFIVTKLEGEDYGFEQAKDAFEASRDRLAVQKIDLYLIHSPEHDTRERQQTWLALVDLLRLGRMQAIGVSNYEIEHIQEIFDLRVAPPSVNQIELSPFNYAKQRRLVEFCEDHDIRLMAYSPLGVGRDVSDPRVKDIADRHGATPSQVLLRWSLQHDFIVIPKADQEDHIRENAGVFGVELSDEEMREMDTWGEK